MKNHVALLALKEALHCLVKHSPSLASMNDLIVPYHVSRVSQYIGVNRPDLTPEELVTEETVEGASSVLVGSNPEEFNMVSGETYRVLGRLGDRDVFLVAFVNEGNPKDIFAWGALQDPGG